MTRFLVWAIRFWRRADRSYRECLERIEALERELFPHLFELENPKVEWLEEDLFPTGPGAVWKVESCNDVQIYDDVQLSPLASKQRAQEYAQALLYEQQHLQRELVARGIWESGYAQTLSPEVFMQRARAYAAMGGTHDE